MPSSPRPVDVALRVSSHEPLGSSHYLLTLSAPESPARWEPGQFAMLSLGPEEDVADPLLRRPFSLFNLPGTPHASVQFFYRVMGRGTELLSRVRPGDRIRCLAPLGNGFAPHRPPGARLLLVAGGIGSASLHSLALRERLEGREPVMLYGCRTADDLVGAGPTRDAGVEVHIATDDGSAGLKGYASDLLDEFLGSQPLSRDGWIVCACGPTPMMKATAAVAARRRVTCYVSLEGPMACGFGVCVGCVVGTRESDSAPLRYRRICVEGPVLDAARVVW